MVNFKALVDKASSPDRSEPDWEAILEIVEEIKTKNVTVKSAVKEFRRKLMDSDGRVVYHMLCVLDSVMKNCASDVHTEILTAEFMSVMKNIVTSSRNGRNEKAIDKTLELIGEWKTVFGQQPGYKAVYDTFGELQREGYHIPETEVASAAFIQKPPEWVLGERCSLCRQEFSRIKGYWRHHCRNCGKSVCAQCSSKRLALTHIGLDQPERVCDLCYKKSGGKSTGESDEGGSSDLPAEYLRSSLAQEPQQPAAPESESKEREEDDLQLAIAMSLSEQESEKPSSSRPSHSHSHTPAPPHSSTTPSAPPPPPTSTLYSSIAQEASNAGANSTAYYGTSTTVSEEQETDPLAHYLDRSYWEQRREKQASGVSMAATATTSNDMGPQVVMLAEGAVGTPLAESVRKTIEQFVQRMQEVSAAGGSVAADPVVLSLFQNLNAMQPQLLTQIDEVQQKKAHQESILHKINEVKEARASLNTMRRQHLDRVRQQEQEQAILGRMQMEQKLALLRQQKAEQFAYHQTLQAHRLEAMQTQRSEYEKQLQFQREMERQQLIAQEQQVLQQQLGRVSPVAQYVPPQQYGRVSPVAQYVPPQQYGRVSPVAQYVHVPPQQYGRVSPVAQYVHVPPQQYGRVSPVAQYVPPQQYGSSPQTQPTVAQQYGSSPQTQPTVPQQYGLPQSQPTVMQQFQPIVPPSLDPASLSMQTLSLHDPTQQVPPLPSKLGHRVTIEPTPPPYQPPSLQTDGLYQPSAFHPIQLHQPPVSSQPPFMEASLAPLSLATQPQNLTSLQPQSMVTQQQQPLGGGGGGVTQPFTQVQPYGQPQLVSMQPMSMQPASMQPVPVSMQPVVQTAPLGTTTQLPPQQGWGFPPQMAPPVNYQQPQPSMMQAPLQQPSYQPPIAQPAPMGHMTQPAGHVTQPMQASMGAPPPRPASQPPLISFD